MGENRIGMETLSKVEMLIVKYRTTIETAENYIAVDPTPKAVAPKAVRFASTLAMIDTFKTVIKDLEALLQP